jgi:hypothetical protein
MRSAFRGARIGALVAIALFADTSAFAQAPAGVPTRVRGQIERVEGNVLHIKDRQGAAVAVRLSTTPAVSQVVKADLGDIKTGTYVGTAAVPQPNGSLRALEVLIFPEGMRGTAEGHGPWDLTPDSTMTNATVESSVSNVSGRALTLKYKGGEKTVLVPPDAPIVTLEPGTPAMLVPGAHVLVIAMRQPDGTITAGRVLVGKDGLVPPM